SLPNLMWGVTSDLFVPYLDGGAQSFTASWYQTPLHEVSLPNLMWGVTSDLYAPPPADSGAQPHFVGTFLPTRYPLPQALWSSGAGALSAPLFTNEAPQSTTWRYIVPVLRG